MQRSTGTLVMLGLGKSRMPIVGSGCGEIESSRRQEGRRFSGGVDRQREFLLMVLIIVTITVNVDFVGMILS